MKPEIRKLKTGLTLLLAPNDSTDAVSLIVYIGAGSRFENQRLIGMTHFLEHILFDGTKKRPTSLDISKEIDILGAEVNAHPMEEFTDFHIKARAIHLEKIVDIFSDMLLNSKFAEVDIAKEKKVIIEEIKMRTDIASSHVFSVFDQAIFAGTTLANYAGGTKKTVEAISRQDILAYQKKFYLADNVYISVCGNFAGRSNDQIAELIEKKFVFTAGKAEKQRSLNFRQKRLEFLAKDTKQCNFVVGFYGSGYNTPDRFGLKLLSIILGGNMSSRMFDQIREKRGLAYDVRTFSTSISDTGTIMTIAGVADEKATESLLAIIAEYEKIKNGVSQSELAAAKSFLLGQLAINLEDSYELGEFYLSQLVHSGKVLTLSEISEKIAKINIEEIKNLAKKYLDPAKMSVAVIAKESLRTKIEKVLKETT